MDEEEIKYSIQNRIIACILARGCKSEHSIRKINLECYKEFEQLKARIYSTATDNDLKNVSFEMWLCSHLVILGHRSFDPVCFFTGGKFKGGELVQA